MLDAFLQFKGVENLTETSEYGHLEEHFYFHQISPDSLLGFNHGRTEKNTLDIFSVIPSRFELAVVFLDEVDSVLGQKDSSDPSMARITQTFQSVIQGGISHQLGRKCFLLTTSNNEDMDQPWQKRFKNRIHVEPPNEENLARFVKLMWAKLKVEFLKECEVILLYLFFV